MTKIVNPVKFDRLQINVTPDYLLSQDTKYENYKDYIIANRKLKDLSFKVFGTDDKNKAYMIDVPPFLSFVTNIRVNAFHPYSVSFKLNFIRLLRDRIQNDSSFNSEYDKKILLDEDNYLTPDIWTKWNTNIVSYLINNLNDLCLDIADNSMSFIIPYHEIQYQNVTVKHVETNIDYNVGTNKSLYYMKLFSNYITSDQGNDFRNKVGEVALKHRIPFSLSDTPTTIEKNETVSIQFQICKSLFCKVYRKTRDHIRFELLFESPYIKNKFKKIIGDNSTSANIKRILKPALEFSKDFFKGVKLDSFLNELYVSSNHYYEIEHSSKSTDFFRQVCPEINDIISCIDNNMPITDKDTISFIKRNPEMSKRFKREHLKNGKKYYTYNITNLDKPKVKRLLPYPTKKAPRVPKPIIKFLTPFPKKIVWINDKKYVEEWSFQGEYDK